MPNWIKYKGRISYNHIQFPECAIENSLVRLVLLFIGVDSVLNHYGQLVRQVTRENLTEQITTVHGLFKEQSMPGNSVSGEREYEIYLKRGVHVCSDVHDSTNGDFMNIILQLPD